MAHACLDVVPVPPFHSVAIAFPLLLGNDRNCRAHGRHILLKMNWGKLNMSRVAHDTRDQVVDFRRPTPSV
jgi:hypothetical protein